MILIRRIRDLLIIEAPYVHLHVIVNRNGTLTFYVHRVPEIRIFLTCVDGSSYRFEAKTPFVNGVYRCLVAVLDHG